MTGKVGKRLIVILALLLVVAAVGCSSAASSKSGVEAKAASSVAGTYVCTQARPDHYPSVAVKGNLLWLLKDGTAIAYAPHQCGVGGEWRVEGDRVMVSFVGAYACAGRIKGATITMEDGSTWVKQK